VTTPADTADAVEVETPRKSARRRIFGLLGVGLGVVSTGLIAAVHFGHQRHASQPPLPPAPPVSIGFRTAVASSTLADGYIPEIDLGQPAVGTSYVVVFGCSGTGTLTMTETDPSGSMTDSIRCTGTYAVSWVFPASRADADGTEMPAGPGPYRISTDPGGAVTAAHVFVDAALR
jgi:hypothetical protein